MITSKIGRTFLDAYNETYGKDYDAKTFFVSEFYPLFFDHPKYMMTAGNSPLENPKLSWEKMILGKMPFETAERRKERFGSLMEKIKQGNADASIAVGYASLDVTATTSGQVSNLQPHVTEDDIYLSWVGAGLGIGVQGGFSILFDHPQILLDIFEGWREYRVRINEMKALKGNQVNTWNGQWIVYASTRSKEEKGPAFDFPDPFSPDKNNILSVDMQRWTDVLGAVARKYAVAQLVGYVYNYGQTNTTVGFIPFDLSGIKRLKDLYARFFGLESGREAEKLWGTAIGFAKACQSGSVGIRAMEPKGLRDCFSKGKIPKQDGSQQIHFNAYKTWIMAMLNNEELWGKARKMAEVLHKCASTVNRGKTTNTNKVNGVLQATNKKGFIEKLMEIVGDVEEKDIVREMGKLINDMPTDNVPYFLTLVRFNYATI